MTDLAAEIELAGVERVPDPHEIIGVTESERLVRAAGPSVAVVAIDEASAVSAAA